jgi:hypothetical protein
LLLFAGSASAECLLRAESCPAQTSGGYIGGDDWNGAGSNESVCHSRAQAYYDWCGSPAQGVTAIFSVDGATRSVFTYPQIQGLSACKLVASGCLLHPEFTEGFDDWNGAGSNEAVCHQRAQHYYDWCGAAPGQSMTSYFMVAGVVVSQNRVSTQAPSTECRMTVPECPNHALSAVTFSDNWDGAGSNETRCLQRAKDYYDWCGASQTMTASFLVNGAVKSSVTYPKLIPPTACSRQSPAQIIPNSPPELMTTRAQRPLRARAMRGRKPITGGAGANPWVSRRAST